jgi:DNA-directed RNA polymerase
MEIHAAITSGNPETFMSSLPVHQDGSCNGLQHYAALGKDKMGAFSVNLIDSDHPQDVYSTVLDIVLAKIEADCAISPQAAENDQNLAFRLKNASLVDGLVNRKVIKQTVMTSVYGVTRVGARSQVMVQLEEKLLLKLATRSDPDFEKELFSASRYVANLTLDSLQEMFTSARAIMDWLATCASLVSSQGQVMSWVTPLGLPVMQPYRRTGSHSVKTILQTITLTVDDEALPVSHSRQRTAFPPNFVHSLDASHMLMTSLKMKEKGLTFASVHDSFWTHAVDIPKMNDLLRDCFVDLYKQPVLENLLECLEMRYPDIKFPPIPERGTLNIESVKNSTYFFH